MNLSLIRTYVERFWMPAVLLFALYKFSTHHYLDEPHRQTVGYFFSGPIYQAYIIISIGLLLNPLTRKRWTRPIGWWALDVSICTLLISQSLKLAVRAPRPSGTGSLSGFPSGHTMFAFALAWLVLQIHPRLGPVWFAIAVAVGWSRVDTQAHFTYQVLCGAAFGTLLGLLITQRNRGILFPRILPKRATAN